MLELGKGAHKARRCVGRRVVPNRPEHRAALSDRELRVNLAVEPEPTEVAEAGHLCRSRQDRNRLPDLLRIRDAYVHDPLPFGAVTVLAENPVNELRRLVPAVRSSRQRFSDLRWPSHRRGRLLVWAVARTVPR